jgi:hypothetical protein
VDRAGLQVVLGHAKALLDAPQPPVGVASGPVIDWVDSCFGGHPHRVLLAGRLDDPCQRQIAEHPIVPCGDVEAEDLVAGHRASQRWLDLEATISNGSPSTPAVFNPRSSLSQANRYEWLIGDWAGEASGGQARPASIVGRLRKPAALQRCSSIMRLIASRGHRRFRLIGDAGRGFGVWDGCLLPGEHGGSRSW